MKPEQTTCKCQNLNNIYIKKDFTFLSQELTNKKRIDGGYNLIMYYSCNSCNKKHSMVYASTIEL